ncbi:G2/mitotic-specific cyclin-B1-like [Protopterus annectens]|uniref:G2/mitotic-specific cyclin-B1-like n=1 Tax=Protopterus annectens TaxID=7888 RepID=UPI001CFA722D|nr:G2/mitotic-specific cyclin-B1-like [Protopterus annectens]
MAKELSVKVRTTVTVSASSRREAALEMQQRLRRVKQFQEQQQSQMPKKKQKVQILQLMQQQHQEEQPPERRLQKHQEQQITLQQQEQLQEQSQQTHPEEQQHQRREQSTAGEGECVTEIMVNQWQPGEFNVLTEKVDHVEQKKELEVPAVLLTMGTCTSTPEKELGQDFSNVLLHVEDVDADDTRDVLKCSEYVQDIYKYFRQLETEQPIKQWYLEGQEITGTLRDALVKKLKLSCNMLHLPPDNIYKAAGIIDRFLQIHPVPKHMLQLVGITALFIAAKYEMQNSPSIEDFVRVTGHLYTKSQISNMEWKILKTLDFKLNRPIPIDFLHRVFHIVKLQNDQQLVLSKYFIELAMVNYDMVHFPPSAVAAAAFRLSQKVFSSGHWGVKKNSASSKTLKIETILQLKSADIMKAIKPLLS